MARSLDPQNSLVVQHTQGEAPGTPTPGLNIEPSKTSGVGFADSIALEPDKSVRSFHLRGDTQDIVNRFLAMFVGDLLGTLIIIYTMKLLLALLPKRSVAPLRDGT